MARARTLIGSLAAVFALTLIVGCEDKPSVATSSEEATVKGKVTINGKTATKGQVQFDPANYKRKDVAARNAPIGADGTYTIKTLTGENRVTVDSPEKKGGDYSMRTFDVKSGENTFDIDVK